MDMLQDTPINNRSVTDLVHGLSGVEELRTETHDIPLNCSLERLVELFPMLAGVNLETCSRLDSIAVQTVNSNYRITLLDPESGRALIEGGKQFPEAAEVMIMGSSFGGSMLRMGWLGVGLRIEIFTDDGCVVTSPVRSLALERNPLVPELTTEINQ